MKIILIGILLLSFYTRAQSSAPISAGNDIIICEGTSVILIANNPWRVLITWNNGVTDGVPFTPTNTLEYIVTAANSGTLSSDTVLITVLSAIDTSTVVSGTIITSNQIGANYKWLDCDNGNIAIAGATNINYVATSMD